MPGFTNITRNLIDLLKEHNKSQFTPRKRRRDKNFPLWVALRGARGHGSKIDSVLSGNTLYPFSGESRPKDLITEKMLKQKSITSLQFAFIDRYLCDHGYYNGHWRVSKVDPPNTVIPIGRGNIYSEKSIVNTEIDKWFLDVLEKIDKPISLRAILDSRVTDLILMKALDITAFRTNEFQKKRKGLHLVNKEKQYERLYPEKNWMYSGA